METTNVLIDRFDEDFDTIPDFFFLVGGGNRKDIVSRTREDGRYE